MIVILIIPCVNSCYFYNVDSDVGSKILGRIRKLIIGGSLSMAVIHYLIIILSFMIYDRLFRSTHDLIVNNEL